ncbi:MAG TPA: DinB family protein [Dehalococcoidia bacterium]|nr:DinB family protein [Dehalococcoidia bacterium]
MDRPAIEDLFAFTSYSWRVYADAVRPLGDEMLLRAAPGAGWPALRDALVHISWAYVRWLADPNGTSSTPPEEINSWDQLEDYRGRVRGRFREYLDSLDDSELTSPREMNIDGDSMMYSPADIFTHVLLHERQHHGDLNTLLYQLGIEPPIVEYRFSLPDRAHG